MLNHWIKNHKQFIIDLRKWLHMHPEVGFNEHETAAHLQSVLKNVGYEITQTDAMKTGFICEYDSGIVGPVLGVRCDMDVYWFKKHRYSL